jgi:thiamine-monophosphate kinase
VGGCDSSDGLLAAVAAIAAGSGCAAGLNRDALPLDPAMAALAHAEAWCLGGGEDFELVLALEPAWAEALTGFLPGSGVIGELAAGTCGELRWTFTGTATIGDGEAERIEGDGYRHFR